MRTRLAGLFIALSLAALFSASLCSRSWGATWHVKSTAGGGGNGSSGNPWTLQEASDDVSVNPGDDIHVWDTGVYALTATWDIDTTAGDGDDPITWRAVTGAGVDDGSTRVLIDGSGISANDIVNMDVSYQVFEGFIFQNATEDAFDISGGGQTVFIDCWIKGSADAGIYVTNSSEVVYLYDTEISGNGGIGLQGSSITTRGHFYLKNCAVHHNGSHGLFGSMRVGSGASDSLFTDNGGDGLHFGGVSSVTVDHVRIERCTIANNGGDGIDVVAGQSFSVIDTVLSSNTAYSINTNGGKVGQIEYMARLCSYPNGGTGHIDILGGTLPDNIAGGSHVLNTDPAFVGASDFAVQLATIIQVAVPLPANGPNHVVTWGAVVDAITGGGTGNIGTLYGVPAGNLEIVGN